MVTRLQQYGDAMTAANRQERVQRGPGGFWGGGGGARTTGHADHTCET